VQWSARSLPDAFNAFGIVGHDHFEAAPDRRFSRGSGYEYRANAR
jgi:hypothetical protein